MPGKFNKSISHTYYVPGAVPAAKGSRTEQARTGISWPSCTQAPNIHPRSRCVHPTCRDNKNISARCTASGLGLAWGGFLPFKGQPREAKPVPSSAVWPRAFPQSSQGPQLRQPYSPTSDSWELPRRPGQRDGDRGSSGAFGKACFFLIERDRRSRQSLSSPPLLP